MCPAIHQFSRLKFSILEDFPCYLSVTSQAAASSAGKCHLVGDSLHPCHLAKLCKDSLSKDGIRFAGFIMRHKWCLLGQNMCQPKCGRGRDQIMHQRCQTQIKVWTIKEIHSRFVKKESNYSKRDIALKLSELVRFHVLLLFGLFLCRLLLWIETAIYSL